MPKLLLFVACEKAIIDQDNNLSLMAVFSEIRGEIPESPVPADEKVVLVPMKWAIVSMWLVDEEELGKEYEQRVTVNSPSGNQTTVAASTGFTVEPGKLLHRVILNTMGFPLHPPGRYTLGLWLNEKGQPEPHQPVAEYPITVKSEPPKA